MQADGIRKKEIKPIDLRSLKKGVVIEENAEELVPAQSGEILSGPELEHNPFIEKLARHDYIADENREIVVNNYSDKTESRPKRKPKNKHLITFGASSLALLAVFIIVSTVFAKLTVNVKLRHEKVALKDVSAAFDTSVSKLLLPQKVIPSQKFELSKTISEDFQSSGKKYVEEKAKGKVKLYNAFSSSPQALVASTRFATDAGIILRLSKSVTVPGAKIEEGKIVPNFIEVELVADEAGDRANLPEGVNLRIPGFKGTAKYDGFYALTAASFGGGYKGEARVVTSEDLKKSQEVATQRVYKELEEEIARKVPLDFTLIDQLRQIEIAKVTAPKADERHDHFRVEARAVAKVIVFKKGDVETLVEALVIKDGERKELVRDKTNVQYIVRNIDFNKGRADLLLGGEATTKAKIPETELALILQGKKEGSILEALKSRSELASFSMSFFPPWLFSAPEDPQKIRFIIDN